MAGLRFVLAAALVAGVCVARAAANDAPWMVQIDLADGTFCQGALVAPNKVMTVASCFGGKTGDVKVRVGATEKQQGGEVYSGHVLLNPDFNGSNKLTNVAIITLSQNANAKFLSPTSYKRVEKGETIVGGAWDESSGLRTFTMERVDDKSCERALRADNLRELEINVMCAKPISGSSCTPGSFVWHPKAGGDAALFGMAIGGDACKTSNGFNLYLDIVNREIREFLNANL